jgi:hypothetical protein
LHRQIPTKYDIQIVRELNCCFGFEKFLEMPLNLTHRHASGIQGQDLFAKARPAGLVLGHDLRLKAGMTC